MTIWDKLLPIRVFIKNWLYETYPDRNINHDLKLFLPHKICHHYYIFKEEMECKRQHWDNRYQSTFVLIGFISLISNAERFSVEIYTKSFAFFFVYLIFGLVIFMPIQAMEISLGQYSSKTCGSCFSHVPILKGLCYSLVTMMIIYICLYPLKLSVYLFFLGTSLFKAFPWNHCNNNFNNFHCVSSYFKSDKHNISKNFELSSEQFIYHYILKYMDSNNNPRPLHGFSSPETLTLISYTLVWFLTFLLFLHNVNTFNYFINLAVMSLFIVVIFSLCFNLMIEGSAVGIVTFFTIKWSEFANIFLYTSALEYLITTSTIGTGLLSSMASYNNFFINYHRDCFIAFVFSTLFFLLIGIVIFSCSGIIAHRLDVNIQNVMHKKFGLFTISITSAYSFNALNRNLTQFIMLLCFLNEFNGFYLAFSFLLDSFSDIIGRKIRKTLIRKFIFTAIVIGCFYLLSFVFIQASGILWLHFFVTRVIVVLIAIIVIIEIISIYWIYGTKMIVQDVQFMVGFVHPLWYHFIIKYVCPILMIVPIISSTFYQSLTINDPIYVNKLYELLVILLAVLICVPIFIKGKNHYKATKKRTISLTKYQTFKISLQVTDGYGPSFESTVRQDRSILANDINALRIYAMKKIDNK